MRLDALAVGPDAAARLVVTVVNNAEDEAKDVVVRALEDGGSGEALGEAYVTAPAMGRAEVSLLLRRMPSSGALRVALTPDALPWDNNAYLVTEQPGVRRVLLVCGGDPATDPAARFVRLALDPAGTHEFFQVDVVAADDPSLDAPLARGSSSWCWMWDASPTPHWSRSDASAARAAAFWSSSAIGSIRARTTRRSSRSSPRSS